VLTTHSSFYSSKDTFTSSSATSTGEEPTWRPDPGSFALTIFLKEGDQVLHTYSTWSRGVEIFLGTYQLLDLTSLGRQEEGPNRKNFRLHDQY
jgi:predicted dithiol-disulfide oxidoreductase (DUF899 family)